MDRIRVLENEQEKQRAALKAILAAAKSDKRNLSESESSDVEAIGKELDSIQATLKAERLSLEYDRTSAPAIDRPAGDGDLAADEAPGLSLPALPKRTRARLAAMGGPALPDAQEHLVAVIRASHGGDPFSPLLASTSGTEAVPSEGGYAVRSDVAAGIFMRAAQESLFLRLGAQLHVMQSDELRVVALDDDLETGDAESGLTAGWTGEGVDLTSQAIQIRGVTLRPSKLVVLVSLSNELAEDSIPSFLPAVDETIGRAVGKRFDRAIISGSGVGMPQGILNSAALVTVAKTVDGDPGTASTVTWKHVSNMWARLAPGSHERAYWLVHPSVLPALLSLRLLVLNVAATENVGGFQPLGAFQATGPTGYSLLGRPVIVTGRVKSLTNKGDILLIDPTQIAIGIRRDLVIDRSPHAYFTSDRLAIRGKMRADAVSLWDTARTLQEGSVTVSPFVALEAR